jgi:hypothetical protein
MKRVHEGAIGDIVAIQEHYLSSPYIVRERRPGQTEMEYQMWNWYHFNWLSGDQTAQQLIHSLDKASWALRDQPPRRVYGLGGRHTAVDPKYGDQFDHQADVERRDELQALLRVAPLRLGCRTARQTGARRPLSHRLAGKCRI